MKLSSKTGGKISGLRTARPVENARNSLVRMGRLELPRPCERWNLNPVRLPIPPHPRRTDFRLALERALRLRGWGRHQAARMSAGR